MHFFITTDEHDILACVQKYLHTKTSPTIIRNDGWLMVFNATFNNISVISWRSVLLMEETGENHRPVASH